MLGADNIYAMTDTAKLMQAWSLEQTQGPVVSTQLQIGGQLFPEYPIQSTQEAFYMLNKSIRFLYVKEKYE